MENANSEARIEPIYEHTKRDAWGVGIIAWQEDDRCCMQFEDGKRRVIARKYYPFLRQVDRPLDEASATIRHLKDMLRHAGITSPSQPSPTPETSTAKATRSIDVAGQIEIFRSVFGGDFQSERYTKNTRGGVGQRPVKRHLAPSIEMAQKTFAKEVLDEQVATGELETMFDNILKVLGSTSLVTPTMVKPLAAADASQKAMIVKALRELLHGEGDETRRLREWFTALRKVGATKWEVATAIPALMFPHEQVFVKPTAVKKQAAWMAPRLRLGPKPTAAGYLRVRNMMRSLSTRLEELEFKPRDLVDVHVFMWETLRPAGLERLASQKS